jgi:hypothetical protein
MLRHVAFYAIDSQRIPLTIGGSTRHGCDMGQSMVHFVGTIQAARAVDFQ